MSIEAAKVGEETPVVVPKADPATTTPVVETPVAAVTETPAETSTTPAVAETPAQESAVPATEDLKKGESVVEAVPAAEGVLGYKEPGFLKQFRYVKHFFWFSDEPSSPESLSTYLRSEKKSHDHAAWARETGKGVLFYSKRAEDKAHPAGLIMLSEVSNVTKEGFDGFSFKVGTHTHRFETATVAERDSWIVAVEKKVEEGKSLKEDITARDTYKKNLEEFSTPALGVIVPKADRSKSKEPKKSLDLATASAATTTANDSTVKTDNASSSSSDEEKKKTTTKKDRSQSRKRTSIFGGLLGKKEEHIEDKVLDKKAEHDVKKDIKAEEKAEKKAEKAAVKEEAKAELEQKKEETKATHDSSKAVEAVEAAAVAAAPGAAIAAEKKHEEKEADATIPVEKKQKRSSVFGIFGKKSVTSPAVEKNEKDIVPAVPAKDTEMPLVSETAPKIDEPIETKPIDTAAVTAPVNKVAAEPVAVEPTVEPTATPVAAEPVTSPRTEKKGGFLGMLKKTVEGKKEQKEDVKADEAGEATRKDPVAAAAPTEPTTETAVETPAVAPVVAPVEHKDERNPRKERRTSSFFSGFGTLKKKNVDNTETSEDTTAGETKREKSPLPKIGAFLHKKPTKAATTETAKEETVPAATTTEPSAIAAADNSAPTTTSVEQPEIKHAGEAPVTNGSTIHDQVTFPVTSTPEVKISA